MRFISSTSPEKITEVESETEVGLCPNCTFPNYDSALECTVCGCSLQDENTLWLRASLVKKCTNPTCNTFFSKDAGECPMCKQAARTMSESRCEDAPWVKICPNCFFSNASDAEKCEKCHYSLEDVDPTTNEDVNPSTNENSISVTFENIRTHQKCCISLRGCSSETIGREGSLSEQLASNTYVGNKHVSLCYKDGGLYITDLSRNGTYIDIVRLKKNAEHYIQSGTVVGLGDPYLETAKAAFIKITY